MAMSLISLSILPETGTGIAMHNRNKTAASTQRWKRHGPVVETLITALVSTDAFLYTIIQRGGGTGPGGRDTKLLFDSGLGIQRLGGCRQDTVVPHLF